MKPEELDFGFEQVDEFEEDRVVLGDFANVDEDGNEDGSWEVAHGHVEPYGPVTGVILSGSYQNCEPFFLKGHLTIMQVEAWVDQD